MQKKLFKSWPFLVILFINFLFFFRLFWPEARIFTTPDFGLSDILHFNYPLRFVLASFLKNGRLPLWVSSIGGGFPLFATGQTGAGNIIVFLTTFLFPPAVGFNLTYVLAFLLMGMSVYLFARLWRLSKSAAFFAAVIFSFSGNNITHFAHTDHLLTVSFVPLVFYTLERALREKSKQWWLAFALAGSQCLLAGNANAAVYGFFAVGIYFLWRVFSIGKGENGIKEVKKIIIRFGLAMFLLLGLSAVQLLPSLELTLSSQRGKTSWASTAQQVFPYPPKHILTFLNPYLFGDPHKATYPMYGEDWGLFWENTAYIGIIPLVLAAFAIFAGISTSTRAKLLQKVPGRGKQIFFWAFLAAFTLLLSLGKYTPFFAILKLPILNLFRIPSTFLFVTDFALAMLAGFGLQFLMEKLPKKELWITPARLFGGNYKLRIPLFTFFFLLFSFLDLMAFGYNYNPIGKAVDWEKPPPTAEFLQKDTSDYRIFSPLSAFYWNKVFVNRGWQDDASEYLPFKNALAPDMNLLYKVPSVRFYSGVASERAIYFRALLVDTFQVVDQAGQKQLVISDSALKMLNITGVKYIVTPGIIDYPSFDLVSVTPLEQGLIYNIYQNLNVLPRARVVGDYEVAADMNEAGMKLAGPNFDPGRKVVLEEEPNLALEKSAWESEVEIVQNDDFFMTINVKMKDNGLLVVADSFYPGWRVWVDGEEKEILVANINQRAVVVSAGEHKVKFIYEPKSFRIGGLISLVSLAICGGIFLRKSQNAKLKSQIYNLNVKS